MDRDREIEGDTTRKPHVTTRMGKGEEQEMIMRVNQVKGQLLQIGVMMTSKSFDILPTIFEKRARKKSIPHSGHHLAVAPKNAHALCTRYPTKNTFKKTEKIHKKWEKSAKSFTVTLERVTEPMETWRTQKDIFFLQNHGGIVQRIQTHRAPDDFVGQVVCSVFFSLHQILLQADQDLLHPARRRIIRTTKDTIT